MPVLENGGFFSGIKSEDPGTLLWWKGLLPDGGGKGYNVNHDDDRKKDVEATDMKGYAIVQGRKVSFELSRGLAVAHRRNAGKSMAAAEAIANVEEHRRVRAIKHASPYVEARH